MEEKPCNCGCGENAIITLISEGYTVQCSKCGAMTAPYPTLNEALEAWEYYCMKWKYEII